MRKKVEGQDMPTGCEPPHTWPPGPTDAASLALTILPPGDGRDLRLQYHPGGWDTHATSPPICLPSSPAPMGSGQDGLTLSRERFCFEMFGLTSKVQRNMQRELHTAS